jgi:RNA polymerase sigma factor (sigma-70 family)
MSRSIIPRRSARRATEEGRAIEVGSQPPAAITNMPRTLSCVRRSAVTLLPDMDPPSRPSERLVGYKNVGKGHVGKPFPFGRNDAGAEIVIFDGVGKADRPLGRVYSISPARQHPPGAQFAMLDDTNAESLLRSQRAEAAYRAHYDLLRFIVASRFKVPADEVCGVIHDVFVSFLRHAEKVEQSPADERAWLIGGVCNASRYYWRKHRGDGFPPDIDDYIDPAAVADETNSRLLLASVLRQLPERCRNLLRKRYSEGYTPDEIAAAESLARGSAKNLISKCLIAARAAYCRLQRTSL